MKHPLILAAQEIRDSAIENARDLETEYWTDKHGFEKEYFTDEFVWFEAFDDATKIDALITALENVDDVWLDEIIYQLGENNERRK